MNRFARYGPIVLRYALALVFLWFGINQLLSPSDWTGWVPASIAKIIDPSIIVHINGVAEIILGLLLILGIFTRIVALLLAIHLFGIATTIGINTIGIRDFGLSFATLSLAFMNPDAWCLEHKWRKSKYA